MSSIRGQNHWWQNWSKTHAYIAERMYFPRSADDIASSIKEAEAAQRPIRAVGGGWSFSDASLPGNVTTNRPDVHGVEAIARVVPRTVTFPPTGGIPSTSIASVPPGMRAPDVPGSMTMTTDPGTLETNVSLWAYTGGGMWTYGQWMYPANDPTSIDYFARKGVRPIRNPAGAFEEDSDVAGSLVMFDMSLATPAPSRDWFYNGKGSWSVGVAGDSPFDQGDLATLIRNGRISANALFSPRAAGAGEALSLVLSRNKTTPKLPEPAYLIDTRVLARSLQDRLPDILTPSALAASARTQPPGARKFYFHVEAGITIDQIGRLLAHQSPPLSLQAISGSPGATLAGALATGTHGAEFKWPLLIDSVKAIHLIGPGGIHWWIEGTLPIADPEKLRSVYPEIDPEHVITGPAGIGGFMPRDWLNAAVVSMGSIGVVYSVVLEVVPQFGVHEAVIQTTWNGIGAKLANVPLPDPSFNALPFNAKLRIPAIRAAASSAVLEHLLDGVANGTGISAGANQYADLAINPIRRSDGDFDAWIGNRELTGRLPVDPQPPSGGETGDMLGGITRAFEDPTMVQKLRNVHRVSDWDLPGIVLNQGPTKALINRVTSASDIIDVGLDAFLSPMIGSADGRDVARELLNGILSGLLGTANRRRRSDKTGVSVGALGFPGGGVMGTALEIALAPADAFTFLETEIIDHLDAASPFFGYISIRVCSQTSTLMGMQQFGDAKNPYSVMIEIVAFATPNCIQFVRDLQDRTVARVNGGLDAMLHWGLENDRVTGQHLRNTMALRRPASSGLSRLDTFKAIRGLVRAPSTASFSVFDNAFTSRMWLNAPVVDDDPKSFGTVQIGTRNLGKVGPWNRGSAPMRIVGVSADGDFRMRVMDAAPGLGYNLEVGPIPAAPVAVDSIFELPLTFIPNAPGPHAGTLQIVTHADVPGSIRIIRIALHAEVDAMVVSVEDPAPPAPLDFGPVNVGDTKTVGIVVRCEGTKNAYLDRYAGPDPVTSAQLGIATIGVGSVPVGGTKTYWVSYTPTVAGPFSTTLTLTFIGGGGNVPLTQDVSLPIVGAGVGAQAELSPSSLDFGAVTVGARTAIQQITIRNVGQAPLTIAGALTGSGFGVAGTLPAPVFPGEEAEADLEFRALIDGPVADSFSIQSNSAQPPVPIALTGAGRLEALLSANPAGLAFGSVPVGSQSPERELVIRNDGFVPVTLGGFAFGGPDAAAFQIVQNDHAVGDVLRPEQECRLSLVFADGKSGPKAATFEIAHDWPNSPFRVPVDGLATDPKGLVPTVTELDFGDVPIGSPKRRQFTLTNTGRAPASISSVAITGKDLADFSIVKDGCTGNQLGRGDKCTLSVAAAPASIGALTAEIAITTDVPVDPIPLRATGLGIQVAWSVAAVDFDRWAVGQTSQRQTVAMHNAGNTPVVITRIDVTGEFLVQDVVPQYPSIAPNGEKYFWVWFRPTAAGPQTGSITLQTASHGPLPVLSLAGFAV